ncbi:TIGR02757 family protein [Arcticibacter eurypsychrophilus]|uniref:TIGR02757 family protein n=1 Tax=Arcticibacter eurypsychrophilus TaxID=1434752 RepID=UPI00084DEC20|nr:TIGR02757 family protein [Arcticibacter eurypsychrophilus]
MTLDSLDLKAFLDEKVELYNRPSFIEFDPIVIPHQFSRKQDIEIMGFFAAILAWGQRKTIINKCRDLIERMSGSPYEFIMGHQDTDLKALLGFKHRTFNDTDLLYFVSFFRTHYRVFDSLEDAFLPSSKLRLGLSNSGIATSFEEWIWDKASCFEEGRAPNGPFVEEGSTVQGSFGEDSAPFPSVDFSAEEMLNHFRSYFFSLPDFPRRTIKHVSSPLQKSTCKRLNMFLRWMVRQDDKGVDFGIWNRISPSQLICPCDLHVDRVARKLMLINRKQTDWLTAVELTDRLRSFDPVDPVRYDFALFGLGIEEKF